MGDFPQFLRSMEVRSEPGMVPGREPFGVGLQKNPALSQPSMQNMRLTFASDGTAIYKPVTAGSSPFQGGSPASSASAATTGVSAAGGGGATGGGGGTGVGGGGGGGEGAGGGSAAVASADAQKGAGVGVGSGGGTTGVTTDGLPRPFSPPGFNMNIGEPLKRKRGRPRKYGPDGTMALGLSPASLATGVSPGSGGYSTSSYGTGTPASGDVVSKPKPRPMGPTKKQQLKQLALLGSVGIGFTPHVITVKAGEDVSSKIMSFSQCGPRAVCILSANGAISNVTLRQAATCGGTVTYEGRFEILSLSGSFLYSESGGQRSRTGGLSVSLAGPDGRVLGGGVAGILTAASPVQVVMGSFIVDVPRDVPRETKAPTFAESPYGPSPTGMTPMPVSPPSHGMQGVPFRSWQSGAADMRKEPKQGNPPEATYGSKIPPVSGMAASSSPRSHGTQSESSGDPDDSPLNHSSGGCNNPGQLGMTNLPWK